MADTAIIYATKEGQTENIARRIADRLQKMDRDVDLLDLHTAVDRESMDNYDGIVVGASVHIGAFPGAVGAFIDRHRDALSDATAAFFSVSLSAADESAETRQEAQTMADELFKEHNWTPEMTASFAGALRFSQYGFVKKMLMKMVARRQFEGRIDTSRDHEFTDWDAVDDFVDRFDRRLAETTRTEPPRTGR